ncbi:hypothetical protein EJB05_40288 [Eragrostis curvula]|uniref:Phosphatidylinositol-specific phospholipase C X domain-containing protein n=1 Tax=Eragrostis curvula TaxID=38414 RepID=A0A5J9TZA6_9POAL|nr:hypothetical protein EJB05_40288 [Eragrostis curvula]
MMAVAISRLRRRILILLVVIAGAWSQLLASGAAAALVGETCSSSSAAACGAGLRCTSCVPPPGTGPAACARTTPLDPIKQAGVGTGLPFNRYTWLTTHNSFAVLGTKSPIGSAIISPPNQEDAVAAQLRNGVRGLMLDAYDFNGDVWLCHSFNGKCFAFTAYVPALPVLRDEIRAFLDSNPSEVVTVFLEDYTAQGSMAKVLAAAGLTNYLFPVANMPKNGADWPLLRDMIAQNHRLIVFTSKQGKEATDGLPYQWNYVVETQYGSDGLAQGKCANRGESRPMDSTAQSLVLMNFFTTNPSQSWACGNNSSPLVTKLKACYDASAKRWPNFIAVDFYMRSSGGGAPLATDVANGRLQCGCDNIAYCRPNAPFGTCDMRPSSSSSSSPAPAPSSMMTVSPGPAPPQYSSSISLGPAAASAAPNSSPTLQRRQMSVEEAATATSSEVPDIAPVSSTAAAFNQRWTSSFHRAGGISLLLLTTLLAC